MTTGKRRRRRKPRQKRRGRWVTRAGAAGVLDVAVRTVDRRRKDLNPGGDLRVLGAIIPCRAMTDPGGTRLQLHTGHGPPWPAAIAPGAG